jgi:hypothetical protein
MPRNPIARALRSPHLAQRQIPSKRHTGPTLDEYMEDTLKNEPTDHQVMSTNEAFIDELRQHLSSWSNRRFTYADAEATFRYLREQDLV